MLNFTELKKALAEINGEYENRRSAWGRGVAEYTEELFESLEENAAYYEVNCSKDLEKAALNGATNWSEYSWGGNLPCGQQNCWVDCHCAGNAEDEDETLHDVIELVKLIFDTDTPAEEVPEDRARFCIDNLSLCNFELVDRWDDTPENREIAKAELKKYEPTVEPSRYFQSKVTAYVLEFYKADEDGNFVEGSDFDW